MSPPRTRPMERSEVALRAAHARQFLEAANEIHALDDTRTNVVASNAVLAGIAAAATRLVEGMDEVLRSA